MMNLYEFEHPQYLYALALLPVLWLIFLAYRRWVKMAMLRFGDDELNNKLMQDRSAIRPHIKIILLLLAFALLIIAAAGPKMGTKLGNVKRKGVELVIALDVSNSMLAQDIKPSRLERAKQSISQLIDQLHNDRFGLIVFAGESYVQLPMTTDYTAAKMILGTLNTQIVPTQGTAIGSAIETASRSFTSDQGKNRAIIIISDGENHEDDALEAAKTAYEKGIVVHTIGMGLPKGSPIPVNPNIPGSFRTDRSGKVVVSKLDETMLSQIAAQGGGKYIRANNTKVGLKELFKEINKLEKVEMESKLYSEYEEQFQYPLAAAIFLLFLELIFLERKNKYLKKIRLFD